MSVGAVALDDQVRVGNVALVVVRVKVDTVPACREHELSANSIRAVGIDVVLGGQEVTVKRAFCSLSVVEAVETDRSLSQIVLGGLAQRSPVRLGRVGLLIGRVANGVVAAEGVTSNHAEADGEGRNGLVTGGGRIQEVVAMAVISIGDNQGNRSYSKLVLVCINW